MSRNKIDVLMIGTGEYTTGFVNGKAADSDKGAGVVGLTMFDLRRRGIVGRVGVVGTNGNKFPGIKAHMKAAIADVPRSGKSKATSIVTTVAEEERLQMDEM